MVNILIDIHLIEAKVNHLKIKNRDSSAAVYTALQDQVFKEHKVSQKQYVKSYIYYKANAHLLDNIYSRVVDSLSLRQKILKMD